MKRRRRDRRPTTAVAATLPDLPRIRPRLHMLERSHCLQIHRASCEILRRTGVEVFHEEGLELLHGAGARIEGNLAKLAPSVIESSLATAPSHFNLYRRGSDQVAVTLDGEQVYFGPGSDTLRYMDPKTGQHRDFMLCDVADCIRVCDALPEIGFVMSVGIPRDVPTERYFRRQFACMLRNTTKPIVFVCDDLADIQAIAEMAAAVAGGMQSLSRYPTLLLYSEPTTPLQHALEAVDKLLFAAKHSIPVTHSPAPMMGGTAPITLAGAVTLGNAEMLSGLVMHQAMNSGAPFLYGHGVHHLDMKEMISVYGAPEFQLARVMAAEMARFYGLPCWGYGGHSDSKLPDAQAAVDAQFSVQTALLARTNLNHDVGYLESGLTNSPEMMVLTNEMISQTRRFMQGVRVDEEALALDVIDDVGPGGEFLSHEHTMSHWRELWLPEHFDRQRIGKWREQGAEDVLARVRRTTISIINNHRVEMLPADVDQEIDRILAR
ncbi:MAG: trimethylamine methyltransferase [Chloroflexi bacterium]|nr:trimethylamine methyltransferase [Chloroflexota bacterium]